MARKGKNFELSYKWLYDLDKDKYKITSPAFLYDPFSERKREIDVLVEFYDKDNIRRKMAIECRDRKNIQDVTWIEQLQQKKEDLSLDYVLSTTMTNFTSSAINKARKHGVILERAETFNINSVSEATTNEFFLDAYFFKLSFEKLNFLIKNKGMISFKEFIKSLNLVEQIELINELNHDYYFSIDPNEILKKENIKNDTFFQNDKDNSIDIDNNVFFENNVPPILASKKVIFLASKIKITPFRLSLPLNKSLSVFEVTEKKNKKFCAIFGNESDYVEIGYIENNNYSNIKFKKRKYLRFAGADMHINTIFPNIENDFKVNWDDVIKTLIGEFDFTKIR